MSLDTIDNVEFENGRLHPDSAARAAIKAMPGCKCPKQRDGEHESICDRLGDRLTDLEALYEQFMYESAGKKTLKGKLAWFFAKFPLRLFRVQIAALATGYSNAILESRGHEVRASFATEYNKMAGEMAKFRRFLLDNFELDLLNAVAENKSLLVLGQEIMLRAKAPDGAPTKLEHGSGFQYLVQHIYLMAEKEQAGIKGACETLARIYRFELVSPAGEAPKQPAAPVAGTGGMGDTLPFPGATVQPETANDWPAKTEPYGRRAK